MVWPRSRLPPPGPHPPDDAAVFGFDIHPPVARIEPLLESIGPVPALAAPGNLEGDLVGMAEGLALVAAVEPMVIDRGL